MNGLDFRSLAQRGAFGILVFLLSSTLAYGATYYVRTDGNNANAGTSNNAGGAWRTIDYAADRVTAGDVVRVQTGTYAEMVTPGSNGASGNLITFVADGTVTMCGWTFSGNSYIRVIGFRMQRTPCGSTAISLVSLNNVNNYLEFWNNDLSNSDGDGFRFNSSTYQTNNSILVGNVIHDIGLSSGSSTALALYGSNNFVAYNRIHDMAYMGLQITGSFGRYYNNYMENIHAAGTAAHPDCHGFFNPSSHAFTYALFEASICHGVPTNPDSKWIQYSSVAGGLPSTNVVFRRNVVSDSGSGYGINQVSGSSPVRFFRMYNNTSVELIRAAGSTAGQGLAILGPNIDDTYVYNNIEWESWAPGLTTNVRGYIFQNTAGRDYVDYNLGYDPDGPVTFIAPFSAQAHPRSNLNPRLRSVPNRDYTLDANSGATGQGGPLTTVSGSGSGTTFNVVPGGGGFFFGDNPNISQYGGNLVVGDTITVGTDVRTVASVSGDVITVTTPFTWANGDPVYFGDDATPDIGAYPYKAGGYALTASYSRSGQSVIVTPSDASLVRFVVCYEDGIPTTVDSSAAFECTVGSGSLEVRVYPLYASETLWVRAVEGAAQLSGPPPPSGLTITGNQ